MLLLQRVSPCSAAVWQISYCMSLNVAKWFTRNAIHPIRVPRSLLNTFHIHTKIDTWNSNYILGFHINLSFRSRRVLLSLWFWLSIILIYIYWFQKILAHSLKQNSFLKIESNESLNLSFFLFPFFFLRN